MMWNFTAIGLAMDAVGFILVFVFGGFSIGSATMRLESDRSQETKPFKILGSIMVIAGFGLQMLGALGY